VTVYLDSSVLLRLVLREPGQLKGLDKFDRVASSELITVESRRTIDRLRVLGTLDAAGAAQCSEQASAMLDAVDRLPLNEVVLARAGDPLPTPLGTLDAIHLATALLWRERIGAVDAVATHDAALGLAARTFGFDVVGV
jgi:predicted nucleic acid-binding protein